MTQMIYVQAGKRIMNLRKKIGFTREELAELAGISSKFLYEIEVGSKGFSAKTLSGLANALGVSCDYILLGIDEGDSLSDIDD